MEIITYHPGLADAVAAAYNQQIVNVPHCHAAGVDQFAAAMRGMTHDQHDAGISDETALVAIDGDQVVGFVHAAIGRPYQWMDDTHATIGIVRFLWYERGRRAVGQSVLEAAHDFFTQREMTTVRAFAATRAFAFYHFHWSCLSVRLDHVHALLGFNGYHQSGGEVFLDWHDYDQPMPADPSPLGATITTTHDHYEGCRLPGLTLKATSGEDELGACQCEPGGRWSHAPSAGSTIMVADLHVGDAYQGKGLGRDLLQRALCQAKELGYQDAVISTAADNFRAFTFYSNYGFKVSDWTYSFEKNLADIDAAAK